MRTASRAHRAAPLAALLPALLLALLLAPSAPARAQDGVPRISVEELAATLGSDDLVVVDVRTPASWEADDTRIPGALRVDPSDGAPMAAFLPRGKTIVLYCA